MLEQRAFMLAGLGSASNLYDLNAAVRLALHGHPVRAAGGRGWAIRGRLAAVMVTAVGQSAAAATEGGVYGFPAALTSFIGRDGPLREVAGLLEGYRLVTVTGPGGSGKTRLAGEVARRVAGRFADGAWLVELAPVQDAAQVPGVVAAALGVRGAAGGAGGRGGGAGAGPAAAAAGAG